MRALFEKIPLQPGESFAFREFHVPRFTMPWHFHPECELTLIVRGRGMRYVGDSIERFQDGDLVLLGANIPHYWWKDADDRRPAHSIVLQFGEQFLGGPFFGLPESASLRRLLAAARRGLAFSGGESRRVAADLARMGALRGWDRLCLLLGLLGRLASFPARRLASAGFSPELDEQDGRRLTAVCRYVNESYAGDVLHRKAATLAGLSPAAFSRFFHKRMGKTFETYIAEIRVGHACRQLMEPDNRIAEAAFANGFNNLSNFNRHFRKLKGMTPREYRRFYEAEISGDPRNSAARQGRAA